MRLTPAQRTATALTAMGVALLAVVFVFGAYRTPLHVCSIVTLVTGLLMWTALVRRDRRRAQR